MGLFASIVDALGPWSWWVLGLVLLGLEILAPGTFFLWFGISALIVGAISLFVVWSWQAQVIVFVGFALVALIASRLFLKRTRDNEETPFLNQRAIRFVGRSFTLTEPIVEGASRLKIGDSVWRISGPDLAAGTKVKVVEAQGALLKVVAEDAQ